MDAHTPASVCAAASVAICLVCLRSLITSAHMVPHCVPLLFAVLAQRAAAQPHSAQGACRCWWFGVLCHGCLAVVLASVYVYFAPVLRTVVANHSAAVGAHIRTQHSCRATSAGNAFRRLNADVRTSPHVANTICTLSWSGVPAATLNTSREALID